MSDGAALYPQLVLEHRRNPRNRGHLATCTHAADGANPLCGDRLRIELRCEAGHIVQLRHSGEACAVAVATASMLGELVDGLDADAVDALGERFAAYIEGRGDATGLGPLAAMAGLQQHPSRRKCALLPWATLRAALAGSAGATTETESSMQASTATAPPAFRAAVAADVDAIVDLVQSAYRGEGSKQGWTTEADMLDGQRTDPAGVAALLTTPGSLVLLAESAGRLLACAHVERQGDAAYFGMFSVSPQLQGGGIGRAMLGEAERIARDEWGCREMQMTVISIRDELIAWYERRGYRRTGQYKPFPYGDERFGVPKRDDLRFELLVKVLQARS
ncbi:SUF system NifU family Fe-S assembly protein [Dokdonella fugitiva]|uniref:SUF system NifU family Fe-S assembly protein n=2 Tax=Dokdonella fugitiva TaxID=328517 RepID=A0A839F3N1_9GAMM|nr:SUF system NifU family Fe-S cluster assembly protein [Dokdonella fugitiva]MBA8889196.1 SUF system NifU family Fe-S assembly protein [Dokdonella fugitiva]